MSTIFLTSLNTEGYNVYGRRFLQEFARMSSNDTMLYVLFEGNIPSDISSIAKNIITLPFLNKDLHLFINKYKYFVEANGLKVDIFKKDKKKHIKIFKNQKFNAFKYARRPFAVLTILEHISKNTEFLIWTDSDLRCKKKFSINDLNKFMPNTDQLLSYLAIENSSFDSGFIAFNLRHYLFKDFLYRMIDVYKSGEIFSFPEWHDNYIWAQIRNEFYKKFSVKYKNLAQNITDIEHIYENTDLGEYFDHLKGKSKKIENPL